MKSGQLDLLCQSSEHLHISVLKGNIFIFKLQDFDGTMSAMSTARVESPGGKISPLDRMEEDRKRRAEIAASAAER